MSNKILLYCPPFYNYEKHISNSLVKNGYNVTLITSRINRMCDFVYSFMSAEKREKKYGEYIYKQINKYAKNIDYFIVIKGVYLKSSHIDYLKKLNPNVKTIMYQWDSLKNHDYAQLIDKFDKIATFDPIDAKKYNLQHLPLFFTNEISPSSVKEDIDLLLIGVFHPERYQYYLRLKDLSERYNLNFIHHIFCPPSYYIRKQLFYNSLHINDVRDIKFTTMGRKKLVKLYEKSKIFVDVCRSGQSGMSMRTIEAYGMNKKLITDNKENISKDKFVHDINMISTSASDEEIIKFINSKGYTYSNIEKLSIDSWCSKLLNLS